jgi:putative membrane protein
MSLILLYAFTAISVAGFAVFGLHPERLAGLDPSAIRFYSISFRFVAVGQVLLAGAVLTRFLTRHAGWKWLTAFGVLYAISLTSELLGTTYGIPFGAYSYSEALKPMWLSRVPVGIPLSWFYMAVPSYAIASKLLHDRRSTAARIGLASFILLAWDLALDPAMSSATRYWEWGESGSYYGMPLLNLFGWYITGIVLMSALAALKSNSWIDGLPVRWLAAFYGANLFLALGISLAAGKWLALIFTVAALGITMIAATILRGRTDGVARAAPTLQPR